MPEVHERRRGDLAREPEDHRGRECVEFSVTDTGIGMTEEQQQRLFRPFAQGDTSISRRYGGTGLGLALVSRFCELIGGVVTATSSPGQGSCFVCAPSCIRR